MRCIEFAVHRRLRLSFCGGDSVGSSSQAPRLALLRTRPPSRPLIFATSVRLCVGVCAVRASQHAKRLKFGLPLPFDCSWGATAFAGVLLRGDTRTPTWMGTEAERALVRGLWPGLDSLGALTDLAHALF
ncbi:hypothetical protein BDZ90DRAFT_3994 [Jaminaea rosea]|uniref:Uncharacterized protein n=1 Tax=Jaminaea rosea TaxID=1569628 RepID=A0A316UXN5_9BASI|nr:hypothetical protein BDZ90DRAFT_3994 [Jaminaea rosea]PWN30069.1 hypothetical protein BDZ90DRAFT_3994 [Jaminaea rosea]